MHQLIRDNAQRFGLSLNKAQLTAFEQYSRELIAWNQRVNLTRIIEPEEIAIKHFLDSLSVYQVLSDLPPDLSMIDVGSGAGFPGLPLKVALPSIQLTLLESTGKKTAFLRHMVDTLQLREVMVLTARAEEAGHNRRYRERYDVAIARAVSSISVLVEYMLPLVKVDGIIIAQKGHQPAEEIETAANALKILGGVVESIIPVNVPGLEAERHLVIIKKIKSTPKIYPRRSGVPGKKPL